VSEQEGGRQLPPAILFLHGNAGDISHRTPLAEGFLREGLSVLLLEYRGYGGSEGSPSEDGFHLDAVAAHDFLAMKSGGAHRVVVFGRSMGGVVAARLAASRPCGALILESTFTSLEAMGRELYPILPGFLFRRLKGRFSALEWVGGVGAPVLIIHGNRDEIVPVDHGRELLAAAPEPKIWMEIEGARHNDVFWIGGVSYFRRIAGFAAEWMRGGSPSGEPTP
jgi:fermentation-respiration switch protein FrsA (DUF1100 family)